MEPDPYNLGERISPTTLLELLEWASQDLFTVELYVATTGRWQVDLVPCPDQVIDMAPHDGPDAYLTFDGDDLAQALTRAHGVQARRRRDGLTFGTPGSGYRDASDAEYDERDGHA